MSRFHVVRQGDHISAIAAESGFANFHRIWDHPMNEGLAKIRDPHVLFPGDRIFVPDAEQRKESRATDASHTFQTDIPRLFLRVKLLDVDGQALKGVPCDVTVPPSPEAEPLPSDGDGVLIKRIPRSRDMRGRVVAHVPAQAPESAERLAGYDLLIGSLDPHTEMSGQQARLGNLGYFAGYGTRDIDALLWAAEEFRCDQGAKRAKTRPGIKPVPAPVGGEPPERGPGDRSGIDDDALTEKLRLAHGI